VRIVHPDADTDTEDGSEDVVSDLAVSGLQALGNRMMNGVMDAIETGDTKKALTLLDRFHAMAKQYISSVSKLSGQKKN
jgi:hypothetical protein